MNGHSVRGGLRGHPMPERVRALVIGLAACGAALALAQGPRAATVLLLPALIILAEFTGRWTAVTVCTGLLVIVAALSTSPVYPLMLTAACALLSARLIRAGVPLMVPVVLLAAAGIAARVPGDAGLLAALPPLAASALLDASFNVGLVASFVILRPRAGIWLPPLRRWRFEDALFCGCVAAFIPAGLLLAAGGAAGAVTAWLVVAAVLAVLAAVTIVSYSAHRTVRGLRSRLREGGVRAVRRRAPRLPRELARLFLAARHVTDSLHRRTAMQDLQVESARLRAQRLQQQVESVERDRRRRDLVMQRAVASSGRIDRRWRAFLDAMPEALFIVDRSGRIEYVNEAVRQLLGHDPGKLAGTRISALIPAAQAGVDPLELGTPFVDGERAGSPAERNLRFSDAGGALRELSARVQVFESPEGKLLALRLREASGPLQRARDQFVASMSHEIRTPLHGLMATLDMLRSEALSPEGSRRLGIARTSAKTLIRIANDVLDLTRISAGGMQIERKPMSVDRLVTDVVDEARAREDALHLSIDAVIGRSLPPAVIGDPLRIKQVLRNLVSNALKFTSAGGVAVSAHWVRGNCTIDVADTGRGIPADRRESIFEAFVQAEGAGSRRQGGAGLGLAIARQLSEAMGGSLSLQQSGPRGSTFRLVLPLPATDEQPLDEQSQRNLQSVKGRILVAEDDEASRYVAQTLLESIGCPARIVANGLEALELLRGGEFDLALLDCEMPGLDGYEVTARIRQEASRHIPIIAMTASAMSADRQRCFDAGMDDLLAKPFGKSALNDILVKWLAPQPGPNGEVRMAEELASRPALDSQVFEELRQSLNWQLPPLRKIYSSVRESAQSAVGTLGSGVPTDLELAVRKMHSLQGGAGLVGARQIEYVAARLVHALKEGRQREVAEGMPLLTDAMSRFNKVVDGRLEALSSR